MTRMTSTVVNFKILTERLLTELKPPKFFKSGPVKLIQFPGADDPIEPYAKALIRRIKAGRKNFKKTIYQKGYITPLLKDLEKDENGKTGIISTLAPLKRPPRGHWKNYQEIISYVNLTLLVNAALQPAQKEVAKYLRPAQAVADDLYNAYLASRRKLGLKAPLDHKCPPLVGFIGAPLRYHNRDISKQAPMATTLEVEQLREEGILGPKLGKDFTVGAAGLPAGYRNVPLIWSVLGHEVGGHYVLTSDRSDWLLYELQAGLFRLLQGKYGTEVARIGVHWTEEAAADVCGVLHLGPSFGLASLVWYTAIAHSAGWVVFKKNELGGISSQHGSPLDTHPCPVLSPHVIRGAVDGLKDLGPSRRRRYSEQLQEIATALTHIKDLTIKDGSIVEDKDGKDITLRGGRVPLDIMQEAAYMVGHHIATVPLRRLRGRAKGAGSKAHDLQDLITWDDDDENAALSVANWLGGPTTKIPTKWNRIQLLSGGILAVIRKPDLCDHVNKVLLKEFQSRR